MNQAVGWLLCVVVAGLCQQGCSKGSAVGATVAEVTTRLGTSEINLGDTLGKWTNALGTPKTIDQEDGGHTFFYWPDKGIGVFCHPLYKGQYESKPEHAWKVTSIFIPLHTNIHPRIPPTKPDARISFAKVLFTPEEIQRKGWSRLSNVEVFEAAGGLESVKIDKPDSLFGDYD
jgi:hypothetical protein